MKFRDQDNNLNNNSIKQEKNKKNKTGVMILREAEAKERN